MAKPCKNHPRSSLFPIFHISIGSKIFTLKVEGCFKLRWIFDAFALPNFWSATPSHFPLPQNLYISDHVLHMARHVAMFCGLTLSTPRLFGMDMHNLKPIFHPFSKKYVGGTPIFSGMCAGKNFGLQHSLGAEIWSFEKVDFSGYDLTFTSPKLLDQCSPEVFCWTQKESRLINYLSSFEYLLPFRRYMFQILKSFKIGPNFACFGPLNFLGGGPPEFWICIFKFALLSTMVQNFVVIGWRTTEMPWQLIKK